MPKPERIVLGSGKLYCMLFEGELPENETIEAEDNQLGLIKGGASVEYTPTYYEAKDDLGQVSKVVLTEETALLKSGIMTWNGETLEKLCDTARATTSADGKTRTVKIGGAGNQQGKKYVIHFLHEDAVDGDIRVSIVGNNQAGFSFAFAKEQETIINAEFKAQPMDKEGTLIYYQEELAGTEPEGAETQGNGLDIEPEEDEISY